MLELKRWDIINHLIKENDYKTYLEIGYYKGWSFDRIECFFKECVDPSPSKTPDMVGWPDNTRHMQGQLPGPMNFYHKMTSDEFFSRAQEDHEWDIIFIDGLHESQQVDRDIQNALKHLSPGGTIVMHDCNPSSYEMTTTGTALGEWTGDVYKSAVKLSTVYGSKFYVVDTDYGVGILKATNWDKSYYALLEDMPWEIFNNSKRGYIDLISPEEFLKRETKNNVETTTDNLLPA